MNVIHVTVSGKTWRVRRAGAVRASKRFAERAAAVTWAKARAGVVFIHGRDGRIAERLVA